MVAPRRGTVDRDFAEFEYTEENLKSLVIPTRGSMRIGMGLAYSADEWKRKRDRILNTPLP
nr:hypothetical protein [Candidatus Sigynarchaeum springense]